MTSQLIFLLVYKSLLLLGVMVAIWQRSPKAPCRCNGLLGGSPREIVHKHDCFLHPIFNQHDYTTNDESKVVSQ